MNKTFIFDLDGVIVDTAKYHYLAWKSLANELGFDFTKEQNEQLKGVSRVKSLEILLGIGNMTLSEERKNELLAQKNEEYLEYIEKMTQGEILPGVKTLLDYLDEHNIKYALGSASKNAQIILKKIDLLHRFASIVDGNSVTKAKPNPEVFLLAAQQLDAKPENCIVVEDAQAGVQAANAANMKSIGIGSETVLGAADYVFNSLTEVTPEFLNKLINE